MNDSWTGILMFVEYGLVFPVKILVQTSHNTMSRGGLTIRGPIIAHSTPRNHARPVHVIAAGFFIYIPLPASAFHPRRREPPWQSPRPAPAVGAVLRLPFNT